MDEKNSTVKPKKIYMIGLALLVPLNFFLLYCVSLLRNQGMPETTGALLVDVVFVFIIMGIARFWKRFRNPGTMTSVAFFSSLFLTFSNLLSISTTTTKVLQDYLSLPDPGQYQMDNKQIEKFALILHQDIQGGAFPTLSYRFDSEHFARLVMRKSKNPSLFVLTVARGAGVPFARNMILVKLADAIKSGAKLSFVKIYHKEQPVLQYRLSLASGEMQYFNFYLFRENDLIKIEDFQFFSLGQRLSLFIAEMADFYKSNPKEPIPLALNNMDSILHLPNSTQVTDCLSRCSPLFQQSRMISRIAIEMYRNAGDSAATRQAMYKFAALYPDDPSLPFLRYRACAEDNNVQGMLDQIDDMYRLIGGDTTLLLQKVNLLAALGKYEQAVQQLDFTFSAFHLPMDKIIETLDMDFMRSPHFKKWQSQRRMVK